MGVILSVIGVGNMANAIITGIDKSDIVLDKIILFDKNFEQYARIKCSRLIVEHANSAFDAVKNSDYVLLSVKPQNYDEILEEISAVPNCSEKIYISIGAGITSMSVSNRLSDARVIRVLPNVPMLIGLGVSVICNNSLVEKDKFDFVRSLFSSAGSTVIIDELDMNKIIGVTSSSPAYVFKFIDSIYKGAIAQGLDGADLLDSICDVVIGSAVLLKQSSDTPQELISKVASKGGTTEKALQELDNTGFEENILKAMEACTKRADELGKM